MTKLLLNLNSWGLIWMFVDWIGLPIKMLSGGTPWQQGLEITINCFVDRDCRLWQNEYNTYIHVNM